MRAMAVHLGVLKFLAEKDCLERVTRISTVSGGSLLVGLVLSRAGFVWPSSNAFLSTVYEQTRNSICARSLLWDTVARLRNPANWRHVLSRANLLGEALRNDWSLDVPLRRLPALPEWSINATTAETGKRFRFKGTTIGDYESGYADAPDFSLAIALAVSAAFPGLVGPLSLQTGQFEWKTREFGEPEYKARVRRPDFATLHLYDGGVYDNLGLEPLYDPGRSTSKHSGDVIIASDAGAPLGEVFSADAFSPWRLKRVADIMADQSRSLRVRNFVQYLRDPKSPGRGAYLQIDNPLFDRRISAAADFTCTFPTTLRQLKESEFDIMAGYGYAMARRVHEVYGLGIG